MEVAAQALPTMVLMALLGRARRLWRYHGLVGRARVGFERFDEERCVHVRRDGAQGQVGSGAGIAAICHSERERALEAALAHTAECHLRCLLHGYAALEERLVIRILYVGSHGVEATLLGHGGHEQGQAHVSDRPQLDERLIVDDRVGNDDGLPGTVDDGRMAPGDVAHHAAAGAHRYVVARLHQAGDAHLQAAYEVGQRVLEAQRYGDAADAQRREQRAHVDAEAAAEHDADADEPHGHAGDVDEDGGLRQLYLALAHDAADEPRDQERDKRRRCQDDDAGDDGAQPVDMGKPVEELAQLVGDGIGVHRAHLLLRLNGGPSLASLP